MTSGSRYDPETLIELVRDRECLFNTQGKEYKNRPMRDKAWMEIGMVMGMNRKFLRFLALCYIVL